MEELREMFSRMEVQGATTEGSNHGVRMGAMKPWPTPSPPILQPMVPAPSRVVGTPYQGVTAPIPDTALFGGADTSTHNPSGSWSPCSGSPGSSGLAAWICLGARGLATTYPSGTVQWAS